MGEDKKTKRQYGRLESDDAENMPINQGTIEEKKEEHHEEHHEETRQVPRNPQQPQPQRSTHVNPQSTQNTPTRE